MKKLLVKAMMVVTMATAILPVNTQAKVSSTRKAEAEYVGGYKFKTDDGRKYKLKKKGFIKGVRYTLTLSTKGTSKKSDDKIKKAELTASMKAVKKYSKGSKSVMQKCAKEEKEIKYFLGENFSEEVKMIKGGDSQWKTIDKRAEQDRIYITWEDGVVLNKNRDGKAYYFKAPYNYISYRGIKGAKKGTIIRTYFVWCTDCNEPDDILARWDVVIKK